MKEELQKIIEDSTFTIMPGTWVYLQAEVRPRGKHFLIAEDDDEITVVTEKSRENDVKVIERNKEVWSLVCLNVAIPFYSVGFLAEVSAATAKAGMNILIVSTYSKDYILVKEDSLDLAKRTLEGLGMNETL